MTANLLWETPKKPLLPAVYMSAQSPKAVLKFWELYRAVLL